MHFALAATLARAMKFNLAVPVLNFVRGHANLYCNELMTLSRIATEGGRGQQVMSIAERLLHSRDAKLSAVLRQQEWSSSTTIEELCGAIDSVTIAAMQRELIRVKYVEKPEGGHRPVTAFGAVRRAYQEICSDLLKSAFPVVCFEYQRRGRGPDRLANDIADRVASDGFSFVAVADVRNCFGSVRKEVLSQLLPIPSWAIDNAMLVSANANIVDLRMPGRPRLAPDDAARQGLPQGASTSGLVMSRAVLGPLLSTTDFVDRVYLHGDNIAVPTRSRQEGEDVLQVLSSLLGNSPVGSLIIGESDVHQVSVGVELVKYKLRRAAAQWGGGHRLAPSSKSFRRFGARVKDRVWKGQSREQIEHYRDAWPRSYSLWQPNDVALDYLRTHTELSSQLGRRPPNARADEW